MGSQFNFGSAMQGFGREVLRDLVTDYGEQRSFDGIDGHPSQDHHGGSHEQVNLFRQGIKGSGTTFRFFETE